MTRAWAEIRAGYAKSDAEHLMQKWKGKHDTIFAQQCMTCDGDADEFADLLSRQEYAISGMCQRCQNTRFGREEVHHG